MASWMEDIDDGNGDASEPSEKSVEESEGVDGVGDVQADETDSESIQAVENAEEEGGDEAPEPSRNPGGDENDASASDSESESETEVSPSDSQPSPSTSTATDGGAISAPEGFISIDEAVKLDHRWRILVWSDPGQGKSHFAHTMPKPIIYIDTEGKGHDIASKFGDDDIHYSRPDDYDQAVDALHNGLEYLEEVHEKQDRRGTIVVDSMTDMWQWSQVRYAEYAYPGKSVDEVEFSSGLQSSGGNDWQKIKEFHNANFRDVIVNCPFHFCWTARREDDYEEVFEGGEKGDKPGGEKHNPFESSYNIRIRESKKDGDDAPVGFLNKSGKTRRKYGELRYPTFPKHKEIILQIEEAEAEASPEEELDLDLPADAIIHSGKARSDT